MDNFLIIASVAGTVLAVSLPPCLAYFFVLAHRKMHPHTALWYGVPIH